VGLLDLTARELLERVASTDPTPGGGSAAALAGALGAALTAMVCAMPKTRTGAPEERERLQAALATVDAARRTLQSLVDEDSAAFDAVMAAFKLPKAGDEEKAARKRAIAAANLRATEVPLQTAESCLVVMAGAAEAARHGNPSALSDARTAAACAQAGLLGAVENVRINARADDPATAPLLARAQAILEEARTRAADAGL
jgi:glutamate formiminotransferase/formiminotetrahydrofolate cyclodeaminase